MLPMECYALSLQFKQHLKYIVPMVVSRVSFWLQKARMYTPWLLVGL